jgi:hypothetical protein
MPAVYSLGIGPTPVIGTDAVIADVKAWATGMTRLHKCSLNLGVSGGSDVLLGRSVAEHIQIGAQRLSTDDPSDDIYHSIATCAVAWSPIPVNPTTYFRRMSTGSNMAAQMTWVFPSGIIIPALGAILFGGVGTGAPNAKNNYVYWEVTE